VKDAVTASVERLYEMFPYPRYPLLARPRWQDGYLTSSLFAARLRARAAPLAGGSAGRREAVSILLGGSGEILPYVVRKWEPWGNHVLSLDLSRTSLRRARLRLGPLAPGSSFVHEDLATWLAHRAAGGAAPFDHVDAFGVLHHMPDPGEALRLVAANLAPGGTMRLMVYNSPARAWIHEVQALLRMLRVSPFAAEDRAFARRFVNALGRTLPALGERLAQMGGEMLRNEARFVDAFLHTREARLSFERWRDLVAGAGLEAYGLFDRYAELDDLANPLWHMPDWSALAARAADGRFENNLELFLAKPGEAPPSLAARSHPRRLFLKAPPRTWFEYRETRSVDLATRWRIWHAFLRGARIDRLVDRLTRPALQRLARLGAIVPMQLGSAPQRALAAATLCSSMDPPARRPATEREKNVALIALEAALKERGLDCDERARRVGSARLTRLAR
jgi:SAM-dependent methyltransferase